VDQLAGVLDGPPVPEDHPVARQESSGAGHGAALGGDMGSEAQVRDVSRRKAGRMVRSFERALTRSGGSLVERFGEETAAAMRREMLDEYRLLIPAIPDIGRWNTNNAALTGAARFLAGYRVILRHGGTVEDAGELIHRMTRAEFERIPLPARSAANWLRFNGLRLRLLARGARRSQARRYPGDWVFEFVPGDGEDFDFGVDYTACGVVEFLDAQGAGELTPYGCDIDYVMAEAIGIGLRRTKTLAWGCDRCDFRMTKDATTSAPWPPRFVERTCGEPAVPGGSPG
jgi:hypothetical protein